MFKPCLNQNLTGDYMAKVKAVLFTSKKFNDGTFPVMLRITHKRKVKYVSLKISVPESHWNKKEALLFSNVKSKGRLSLEDIKIKSEIGLIRGVKDQGHDKAYKYVKMNNISVDGKLDIEDVVYINASQEEIKRYSLVQGDLLFNTRNSVELVGKTALFDSNEETVLFNNNIMRLQFKDSILPYFINYAFKANVIQSQLEGFKSGTTNVSAIYYKNLKTLQIPLPPLKEQKRIVAKLDALFQRIDKSIALLQENILQTEKLMASVLNEMFAGKKLTNTLEEFDKIVAGGTPLRSKNEYWNGNIPWLTSRELNTHFVSVANESITELGLKESNAKLFSPGTLLCGMYDTAAMKMSILKIESTCNQAIVGIKPDDNKLNVEFLKYQLEYRRASIMLQRRGVRQKNLNASMIKAIEIWVPAIQEQLNIVKYINNLISKQSNILSQQQTKLNNLKALKESLLDKAFKGEL